MLGKWNWARVAASAAALACATLGGTSAYATPLKFTLTDGAHSSSWIQDSDPTPLESFDSFYTIIGFENASGYIQGNGSSTYVTAAFVNYVTGVDVAAFGLTDNNNSLTYLGDQLYSGTESAPHFSIGTYNLWGSGSEYPEDALTASPTLTIGPAAPAPLVGSGLLAAVAALAGLGLTRLGKRKVFAV